MNQICSVVVFGLLFLSTSMGMAQDRLSLVFLGDQGHHQPARRAMELLPALAEHGIDVVYTEDVAGTLNRDFLDRHDGLILYANIDRIEDGQADALLGYVADGGGFIPLHCASYCFRNNDQVVALMGAQFLRHGTGVFRVYPTEAAATHPIMQGYESFESWDETYVHTKHNPQNRTVLEYRLEGEQHEPWTWVRTHGQGRVFYTAWGHDQRTFTHPGFHNLVERGIRWACGADPTVVDDYPPAEPLARIEMTPLPTDLKPFEYIDVGPKIPNYRPDAKWGTQDAPRNLMQVPLEPEESMKHYRVPVGFHLDLFASEPDLGGKPICMTWDHRGRLWVAETYDYPNELQPEGAGRDRIRICEDTDGDGHADKFTVFAEQLSIPTSMLYAFGGVIVHQAPHTLFLKDTDGDDVADVREVLFSGWSTNDTHAGPSNLNYGPDNWVYGQVGYAGFEGEIAGQTRSFRTGFYRFRVESIDGQVEVTDFEFLRNTNNNSWGVGFSEEGLLFGSTANRNPSEFMPIANRYYERVRGWTSSVLDGIAADHYFKPITDKVRQVDHHGGFTAGAGHALYTARRYPQAYWNRTAFVAGPTGHLVGTFVLKPKGAGFRSKYVGNLMASDDEWAAPIMAEVGPDGNVWVIDWYNYIVQHNPTPIGFERGPGNAYMTDLRDKKHGRIYRVVYGDVPPAIKTLHQASPEQLVNALTSDNLFWRRHAQRLLIESGNTNVLGQLRSLAQRQHLDAIGLDVGAIHALRTMDGLGAFREGGHRDVLASALTHPSSGVVRTAVEVLPRDSANRDLLLKSSALRSDDPQVRLSSLLALADMPPSDQAAAAAIDAMQRTEHQSDIWMLDAATSAAATNGQGFLIAATEISQPQPALLQRLPIVAEHVARERNRDAIVQTILRLPQSHLNVAAAIGQGWAAGWPKDEPIKLNEQAEKALLTVFERSPVASKSDWIRLAASWGSQRLAANAEQIAKTLLAIVGDESANSQARIDAAGQLIELMDRDDAIVDRLLDCITPQTDQQTAVGIIQALASSRASGLGETLLGRMSRFTPTLRAAAIRVLLSRAESTKTLLAAIGRDEITRQDLTLDQQQALLSDPRNDIRRQARSVLSGAGGLPDPDRTKILTQLMPLTEQIGNVDRGKVVFVKNCANCHTHSGEGQKVGPDLTGMAVHPKSELLTHIIDPSRSVEGNYRSYTVLTIDGVAINGMLASETKTAIEMIDAQGKKHVVLREDIDQLVGSRKSVMPEGFEKQIDRQGFIDLLEFLTYKGKYLPLPLHKVATVVSTKGMFHDGDDGPDRIVFDDWSPKMVGDVPFVLVDPQGKRVPNIILLHGPRGTMPPQMPESVSVLCNAPAREIHFLGGVSGWGFPAHQPKSVSMVVRLHLADGTTEDHPMINGVHLADYIRRVDVPGSEFAMMVGGQQLRHVVVKPKSDQVIKQIELIKGDDPTAPIVVAITVQTQ